MWRKQLTWASSWCLARLVLTYCKRLKWIAARRTYIGIHYHVVQYSPAYIHSTWHNKAPPLSIITWYNIAPPISIITWHNKAPPLSIITWYNIAPPLSIITWYDIAPPISIITWYNIAPPISIITWYNIPRLYPLSCGAIYPRLYPMIVSTKKVNVGIILIFWTYGKFWIYTLLSTLVQLLHYTLKCNYCGMTTVSLFLQTKRRRSDPVLWQ